MSTIVPHSEQVRQAARWISEARKERPGAKLFELVDEAARRFDLSPLEEQGLFRLLKEGEAAAAASEPKE